MDRPRLAIVVAAALLLGATLLAAPAVAQDGENETVATGEDGDLAETEAELNGSDGDAPANETTVSIGQQISLIVAAQQSEIESELGDEAFRYTFERGDKPDAVRERVRELHDRIRELTRQQQQVGDEWKNGTISREQYLTQKTALSIRAEDVNASLGRVNATATEEMSATERQRVDLSQVRRLQHEARNLSGPETAAVARSLGGRAAEVGGGPDDADGPDDTGRTPGDVDGGPDGADESGNGGPVDAAGGGNDGRSADEGSADPSDTDDGTPSSDTAQSPNDNDDGTPSSDTAPSHNDNDDGTSSGGGGPGGSGSGQPGR